jgi:hypothetical protein
MTIEGTVYIETRGTHQTHAPFEAWFETGPDAVYAEGARDRPSAFVRVMLLPAEWEGKRTIRYLKPEDAGKPKLQTARIYFDMPLAAIV